MGVVDTFEQCLPAFPFLLVIWLPILVTQSFQSIQVFLILLILPILQLFLFLLILPLFPVLLILPVNFYDIVVAQAALHLPV